MSTTLTAAEPLPATQRPLIELRDVVKEFPVQSSGLFRRSRERVQAVSGISLDIRRGETLALVGETGCGKSTLARCLVRLHDVTSGSIRFDGHEIASASTRAMQPFRRRMQMIFQDPYGSLNPRRRVGAMIGDPFTFYEGVAGDALLERVREMMTLVGLNPEHYNRFPGDFSGGQRQRVGIARALALRPELVVCDEPVSALDVSIQAQILNLLMDLQGELRLTYLFISHDLSVVRHVSDRVAVMYLGCLVEIAPVTQLFAASQHPYTRALLSSVPVPRIERAPACEEIILLGDPPSPMAPPSGCRFHPRCPRAQARCQAEVPVMRALRDQDAEHLVACHFPLAEGETMTSSGGRRA